MNKGDLIGHVADAVGLTKKDSQAAVDATLEHIVKAVSKGDSVALPGFGTFLGRERAARDGRNPQTGAAIKIKAATVPAFKAGQGFKDAVNGSKPKASKPKSKAKKR